MRVGSVVFATDQGLGILAKSFFDHGIVTDVAVLAHGRRTDHWDWYPNGLRVDNIRSPDEQRKMQEMCAKMDAMLFIETPFIWELLPFCKQRGVKTVLAPMYECEPVHLPALPDMFVCPSLLDMRWAEGQRAQAQFIPVPVEVPWRRRTHAFKFVHNAGHGGLKGRNGTAELLDAWQYVKSPVMLIIRMQEDWRTGRPASSSDRQMRRNAAGGTLEVRPGSLTYEELWKDGGWGDVFIFPEKHNGLSLPLQEARAAGMLVMATDRFPMNTWLPTEPLIMPSSFIKNRLAPRCVEYNEAVIDPKVIAAKIDDWFERDLVAYSEEGRQWAESMSWSNLGPRYKALLEHLCSTP
jgi:hypothetical protein